LAIPAISETSGENCVQNVKADISRCLCFLHKMRFNRSLFIKMTKNKIGKTNCCIFGCNTCRKSEPEACFHLFPRKSKLCLHRKCFRFERPGREKKSIGKCFINGKTLRIHL
jgi:hypothetical protein